MRDGDDPRDIYWKKSTLASEAVIRERVREARRDVSYSIDTTFPGDQPTEDFSARLERRVRDVASRAVAHLKRGDDVLLRTTAGERVRGTSSGGADPVLRFLALLEAKPQEQATKSSAPPDRKSGPQVKASARRGAA